jgi:hypothetical protein
MSDDAVDYGGTSDSDSESDKVPSRLPARAEQAVRIYRFGTDGSSSPIFAGSLPSTPLASIGACKANGTKDHPAWASVPIATDPNKYDPSVLLLVALNPIKVYESIIASGTAGTEFIWSVALACPLCHERPHVDFSESSLGREGCHSTSSIAQLIMSDLQTSMGDDILQMIVCLRDGKEAVEQLKAMYPEEANNVALDIKTKLGELALQHQASAPEASAS